MIDLLIKMDYLTSHLSKGQFLARKFILLVTLLWCLLEICNCEEANDVGPLVQTRGLYPSVINLAAHSTITANATCGVQGREHYCKLVEHGRRSRKNNCWYCNSRNPREKHSIEYAIDGRGDHWWQSPSIANGYEYHWVTITLDLKQVFQTAYVIMKSANSPRPGNWILEKSIDGINFEPWQYFAMRESDCMSMYGLPGTPMGAPRLLNDDDVICTTYFSQLIPLENGEIHISLINGRPSAKSPSNKLIQFTSARYVRIRLQRIRTLNADLMTLGESFLIDPSVTNRYFYSLKDISIGGMCICYGHASDCPTDPRTGRFFCQCAHNTSGKSCERCASTHNQVKWQPGGNGFQCEECNCHGHASSCHYDSKVDEGHLSLNMRGEYIGGGVCENCKDYTEGINCQSCIDGYFRPLGTSANSKRPCVHCECDRMGGKMTNGQFYCRKTLEDGNKTRTGPTPGDCECNKGYAGSKCEMCAKGYTGFPYCELCSCSLVGSLNVDPCDGTCRCKENVSGENCDQCKPGYFNLQPTNSEGCERCFCSGATRACKKAELYRSTINTMQGWKLRTRAGSRSVSPSENITSNELYSVHQTTINGLLTDMYYWSAPKDYLGNLLTSYGGNLMYTISYDVTEDAVSSPFQDIDILIKGHRTTLIYQSSQHGLLQPGKQYLITIPLVAEDGWMDSYSRSDVNRDEMLAVLSNVKSLLIRSVYNHHPIAIYRISHVTLDTATPRSSMGSNPVHTVEICHCPVGHTGLSCEECSPGFYRQGDKCKRCECHGHSNNCNILTGACEYCQHNTTGRNCERCFIGFYGDARKGTPYDCQKCACPLEISSNNFSPTCIMDELDDEVRCLECPTGYTGSRCEQCIQGYYGNPLNPGGTCEPCMCNGNSRTCDRNGICNNCEQNTFGDHCELCAIGYYRNPDNGITCLPCLCDKVGSPSRICNQSTGQCSCMNNLQGRQCNQCQDGSFFYRNLSMCVDCNCDTEGSVNSLCNSAGVCQCKIGVTGTKCNKCTYGYYGFVNGGCKKCNCEHTNNNCDMITGECVCPPLTQGSNCSQCIEEAYGWDKQSGCKLCECSMVGSNSDICDATGQCNCNREFQGMKCDQCRDGYFNFPICNACFCNGDGTEPSTCEENTSYGAECSCANSGQCKCKENVIGHHCDQCAVGSFSLDPMHSKGCTECYCSGVSDECMQASYVWGDQISLLWPMEIVVSLSENPLRIRVSNKVNTRSTSEGIYASSSNSSVEMNVARVQRSLRSEPYFWRLPQPFNGDKLLSYGGLLKFKIYYNAAGSSSPATRNSPIVVIRGKGRNITVISYKSDEPINHMSTSYTVKMREEGWTYLDTDIPVTRQDFARVLRNIDLFLIRASYGHLLDQTRLSDVFLDVAVYGTSGRGDSSSNMSPALGVEQCVCPQGYVGMSCQDCDFGYTQVEDNKCVPCNCNNKSDSCNLLTGKCYTCTDNFAGDNCERCATGYYMTPDNTCEQCACPLPIIGNNFSPTCHATSSTGAYICDNCPVGFEGQFCERCSENYYGNPQVVGGYCHKCSCNTEGSISLICDRQTGQCQCKPGITGQVCDQCKPKHVITQEGCIICNDGCSGKQINELEAMLNEMKSINLNFFFPPPWEKLTTLQNETSNVEREINQRKQKLNDLQNFFDKLPVVIDEINATMEETSTNAHNCYLDSDDILYKINRRNKLANDNMMNVVELRNGVEDMSNKVNSLLLNIQNGTLTNVTMAEVIVNKLMQDLKSRDLNMYQEIADEEFRLAKELVNKVEHNFTQRVSALAQEYNDTRDFVGLQLDDIEIKRNDFQNLLTGASARLTKTKKLNLENDEMLITLMTTVDDLHNLSDSTIKTQNNALDIINEIRKLLNSGRNEIAKENQLVEKLRDMKSQMKVIADKVVGIDLINLRKLVRRADDNANNLLSLSQYFERVLKNTYGLVYNETEAATRFQKIVRAIAEANDTANEALDTITGVMTENNLLNQVKDELRKTNVLLNKVSQLTEIVKGDETRLEQFKNETKFAKSKVKEFSKTIKRINRRIKRLNETEMVDLAKVKQTAEETLALTNSMKNDIKKTKKTVEELKMTESLISQQGRIIKTIKENGYKFMDYIPKLLSETSSSVLKSINSQERIKLMSEQVQNKIKDVRKLIEESRKKAASIDSASVKSDGQCYMRYDPPFSPSLHTEITMHIISRTENNMIFLAARDKEDFLSIESSNGNINVTFDLGDGPYSVTNKMVIMEDEEIENDWYQIVVNRNEKLINVTVTHLSTETSTHAKGEYPGESTYLDVNENDIMFVGGIRQDIMASIPVSFHQFTGCLGKTSVQSSAVGLWDFREISDVQHCSSCLASPSESSEAENVYHYDGESYTVLARHPMFIEYVTNTIFTFKTFSDNGLLFYQASNRLSDFISLELLDGYLQLRIDLGSGEEILKTLSRYNIGEWVQVSVKRSGGRVQLKVMSSMGRDTLERTIEGSDGLLNIAADDITAIGGYPPTYIAKSGITKTFYIGCIKSFLMYNRHQSLAGGGDVVLRVLGVKSGCPKEVTYNVGIGPNGYLQLPADDFKFDDMLSMTFNTKQQDAMLMLSVGESKSRRRRRKRQINKSFYSLSLVSGKVHAWFYSSNGHRLNLTSELSQYANGMDHTVKIAREGEMIWLDMNDGKDVSNGNIKIDNRLIRASVMYIGGLPNNTVHRQLVPTNRSLNGCVREIRTDSLINFLTATNASDAHFGICRPIEHDAVVMPTTPSLTLSTIDNKNLTTRSTTTLPSISIITTPKVRIYPDCSARPNTYDNDAFHFGHSKTSHMQFAFEKKIGARFRIKVSIKTFAENGLILFCGHDKHKDFFSLQIIEKMPVFQFDVGAGIVKIVGKSPVNDGKWHEIRLKRNKRTGTLYVDDKKQGSKRAPKGQMQLNVVGILYIGGKPESVPSPFQLQQSIDGCVKDVYLAKSMKLDLSRPSFAQDVQRCYATYETGASFMGDSYAVYKEKFRVGTNTLIELEFRTWVEEGVLFSVSNKSRSDGLALEMINGSLTLRANNGAENFETTYVPKQKLESGKIIKESLCDGKWHHVRAVKDRNKLTLMVGATSPLSVESTASTSSADTSDPLYIGGIQGNVANQAQLTTLLGFEGCIRNVKVEGQMVNFSKIRRKNVFPNSCPSLQKN